MRNGLRSKGLLWRWTLVPLLFFSLFVAGSCAPLREPEFRGVVGVDLGKSEEGEWLLSVKVRAYNPNRQAIRLTKADFTVWLNGAELGQVHLAKPVRLAGNSEGDVLLPLALHFRSKADEFRVVLGGLRGGFKRLEVSGDLRGKLGLLGKRIHIARQPLQDVLGRTGGGVKSGRP